MLRVTYELDPPEAADTLALIESVGRADGPEHIRRRVLAVDGNRVALEFPAGTKASVSLLVPSLFAGEWGDSAAFSRCRLVAVGGLLARSIPGRTFDTRTACSWARSSSPVARPVAGRGRRTPLPDFAAAGADLVKDDELLGDPDWCPLGREHMGTVADAGVDFAAST